MAGSDQFCLRWNDHQNTLLTTFDTLLDSQKLTDVTLWASGKCLKAHKVVLSACSPYFDNMLEAHDEKNPIIVFNDLSYEQLRAMLEYMYRGEVNVSQEQLDSFLKAAEALKIKGLTDQGGGSDVKGGGPKKKPLVPATLGKDRDSPNRKRKRPPRRGSESGTESVEEESKSESSAGGLLQPKVELTEDNGGGGVGVEDLTMMEEEEEEEYYHPQGAPGSSRLAEGAVPPPHPPPDIKDFSSWDMTNDSFMGAQEISGNNSLNSSQVAVTKQRKPVYVRERILQLMQRHHNRETGNYECGYCPRYFLRGVVLYRHLIYECLGAPVIRNQICPYCNFVARSKRTLVVHMAAKHKPQLEV